MKICPNCKNGKLFNYFDLHSGFIQSICWNCGHYESNSPAYKLSPKSFENLFRDNPLDFMKKCIYQPIGNKEKSTEDDNSTC